MLRISRRVATAAVWPKSIEAPFCIAASIIETYPKMTMIPCARKHERFACAQWSGDLEPVDGISLIIASARLNRLFSERANQQRVCPVALCFQSENATP